MFVKITNGQVTQYPYTVGDLRRDNPNVSFPKNIPTSVMARYGMHPVDYQGAPEYDPMTHRIEHSNLPELDSGRWIITKTVVALTEEQIAQRNAQAASDNRKKRNKLLAETDYFALSDVTMSTEMTTYRQALRDITTHDSWPNLADADWPTKP